MPAKDCTWVGVPLMVIVVSLKVTLPSIVRTSAMLRLRSDTEMAKTSSGLANFTETVAPPTTTETSTGAPLVLTCRSTEPLIPTLAAETSVVPET